MAAQQGQVIGERYRLEQLLGQGPQGDLWRASDQLAAEAPMALRLLGPELDGARARQLWGRLQGVLHPQVPRLGAAIPSAEGLWLVREWQAGRTYRQLLEARAERQLVFGAGEVLLLLRQLLPVLAVLHSQELVHGDLSPANLLRRDSDGLPVLLDFGLVAGTPAVTPGYAPPERARAAEPEPWMDLHALGVVALVLLSGEDPARLLDPVTLAWRWPAAFSAEPELQAQIRRLLGREPGERFASASQALVAFQALPMPESTGPVPRADRTVALVPPPAPPAPAPEPPLEPQVSAPKPVLPRVAPPPPAAAAQRSRLEEREEAAEGGIWPVVIALVLSAVVGTALGWWWLSRGRLALPTPDAALQLPNSLPPAEVDQRQQLLNRLRAMQVDRGWFLKLVDASLLAQFPERGGRLPSDSLEDAPLRKVWNELSEEWLARVEQLPLDIRRRLGSYTNGDWERRQQSLVSQGLSSAVLRQLVSGSAQSLLPGRPGADIPPEPFRQLWFAAAEQGLANVQIEAIEAQPQETRVLSAQVEAGGARLFPVRLPPGYRLVLGVNGSPLMQMSVFGPDGDLLEAKGPLRVVSLGAQKRSPVQVLVTNEGVAPALITLSLRADPPAQATPEPSPQAPPAQPETPQAPAVQAPAAPSAPTSPSAPPPPVPSPEN
ncbi:phosphotransferase [Cyanobium sp. FACHB-13342]|uniref:serine/threonine protein kinase n=1 Tax=Cyanobium sp. FACHB-13342 TaxID=2692793 RepID=UPI001681A3A7|nr:phosphotransferase [Cyanobium sp. FACHB-13342]MBD2422186.1 phosphotransferase [Cyanobium sp. FACHB-13342]